MKLLMIILVSLFVIAFIIYNMTAIIKIKTIRKNDNDVIVINIKTLYNLINIKFEIPYVNFVWKHKKPTLKYTAEIESKKSGKLINKFNKLLSPIDIKRIRTVYIADKEYYKRLWDYIALRIKISDLMIILKLGFEDAAITGLAYGSSWLILGCVISLLQSYFNITIKKITVVPCFDKKEFNCELNCIISFKVGHIINAGLKAMLPLWKTRKQINAQELSYSNK